MLKRIILKLNKRMKKNYFKGILMVSLSVLLTSGFTSCSDDPKSDDPIGTKTVLLSTLESDSINATFSYDSQNRLVSILSTKGAQSIYPLKLTYNAAGQITQSVTRYWDGDDISTEYVQDYTYSKDTIFAKSKSVTDTLIVKNDLLQLLKNTDANASITYTYTADGDLSESIFTSNSQYSKYVLKTTYEYDNTKIGLKGDTKTPSWILVYQDDESFLFNTTKLCIGNTEVYNSSETDKTTYAYEFKDGRPSKITETYSEKGATPELISSYLLNYQVK